MLKRIYDDAGINFPFKEKGKVFYDDICPFTVFGSFNKGIKNENRVALLTQFAKYFSISEEIPTEFDGIPVVMPLSASFFANKENREEKDIDNLWELFEIAINYSNDFSLENKNAFIKYYNQVIKQKHAKWNITMGLYWIRPYIYLNLDSTNRAFLTNAECSSKKIYDIFSDINKGLPDGEIYLDMCNKTKNIIKDDEYKYHSFPELSYNAWLETLDNKIKENKSNGNVEEETKSKIVTRYPVYTKEDFLEEVFMDETDYNTLVELLDAKYNIILQGAPGVGKTFAAKRLAYSIMGEMDTRRVTMLQFHQSYNYEDFIQGYRPVDNGFKLEMGSFYKFCKEAELDAERPYFFIIDEINRGNLSKIFGELMMLIEKEHRGEKMKLLYKDELFTVPRNVRIIGMMNTADRSLAMMDYALRRRFAFYEFAPAFSNEKFCRYIDEKNNQKLNKLISTVESLNNEISRDDSLGDGFRIGHSYFCTDKEITDTWLKSVVEYEIIPMLREYWFDETGKVRDWSANLRSAIK